MIIPSADIEAALRQHLPAEQHQVAAALAAAISDAMSGAARPAEVQARLVASPELASAMRSLAGREIAASSALISFGTGNQIGDMTISGDVAGGNITKLTVNVAPQTIINANLSPRDRDNRQRMLDQIHLFWIAGVLEQSLYRELLISLSLQTDPRAVSFSGPKLAALRAQEAEALPAGITIAQAYEQANRRLLILGAPGAGKTTLLLDLTRHLLEEARYDETRPIPVIFNLSSWAQRRQPLEQWLVQELRDQYGLSKRFAKQWLGENNVLPLLDGLDEVAEPQRAGCVAAINTFMDEHGAEGIVVCARVADYEAIGAKLSLDAAVQVQPLDDAQIDQYLAWAGAPLAGVKAVIDQDRDLRELARAPLMLNIVSLAYQGQRPEELLSLAGEAQRCRLFDSYVQRMFDRPARSDPHRYTRKQTLRWLRWLARSLKRDNQTVFQIELMQPWWLRSWWQRGMYVLFATLGGATSGAILGVFCGAVFSLITGLGLKAMTQFIPLHNLLVSGQPIAAYLEKTTNIRIDSWLNFILSNALISGLSNGLLLGLAVSLFQPSPRTHQRRQMVITDLVGLEYLFWTILGFSHINVVFLWGILMIPSGLVAVALVRFGRIQPTESVRWSWHYLRARWYLGLVGGLVFGLLFGLLGGLTYGLVGGLIYGLPGGVAGVLIGGLVQVEVRTKNRPNQGTWRGLWRAIGVGLVVGLLDGLVIGLGVGLVIGLLNGLSIGLFNGLINGLFIGLTIGPVLSFYFGGLAFVQHFALRLVCKLSGDAPWRYPRFLDYTIERILLRRVGGSYIFVHRLLMEHVAGMTDEEIGRS